MNDFKCFIKQFDNSISDEQIISDIEAGKYMPDLSTCIHMAVHFERPALVTFFVSLGADVKQKDRGLTLLGRMMQHGHCTKELARALFAVGADPNEPMFDNGPLPLRGLVDSMESPDLEWFEIFLAAGADPLKIDYTLFDSALGCAFHRHRFYVVRLFIAYTKGRGMNNLYSRAMTNRLETIGDIVAMNEEFGWPNDSGVLFWSNVFCRNGLLSKIQKFFALWMAGVDMRDVKQGLFVYRLSSGQQYRLCGTTELNVAKFERSLNLLINGSTKDIQRGIDQTAVEIIGKRSVEICTALQTLRLPALVSQLILQESFGAKWPKIPDHVYWMIVTAVKHFHDPAEHPGKRRRVFAGFKTN